MIKLACESDRERILDFCASFSLGVRVSCFVLVYGLEGKIFSVHIQLDDVGKIIAAVGNFGRNCTVICTEETDFEELSLFFSFSSYRSVMGDRFSFDKLGIEPFEMKKLFCFEGIAESFDEVKNDGNLRKMFSLVCAEIIGSSLDSEENYLEFLSDFTHRRLSGFARIKMIEKDGELFASCLTSAEDENRAIIGAVVSSPLRRGSGFGKKVVLSMAKALADEEKMAYVIALNEKAEEFYKHIGFKYIGDICQYKG